MSKYLFTPALIEVLERPDIMIHWHSLKYAGVIKPVPRAIINELIAVYEAYTQERAAYCLWCPVDNANLLEYLYTQYEKNWPTPIVKNLCEVRTTVLNPLQKTAALSMEERLAQAKTAETDNDGFIFPDDLDKIKPLTPVESFTPSIEQKEPIKSARTRTNKDKGKK